MYIQVQGAIVMYNMYRCTRTHRPWQNKQQQRNNRDFNTFKLPETPLHTFTSATVSTTSLDQCTKLGIHKQYGCTARRENQCFSSLLSRDSPQLVVLSHGVSAHTYTECVPVLSNSFTGYLNTRPLHLHAPHNCDILLIPSSHMHLPQHIHTSFAFFFQTPNHVTSTHLTIVISLIPSSHMYQSYTSTHTDYVHTYNLHTHALLSLWSTIYLRTYIHTRPHRQI